MTGVFALGNQLGVVSGAGLGGLSLAIVGFAGLAYLGLFVAFGSGILYLSLHLTHTRKHTAQGGRK